MRYVSLAKLIETKPFRAAPRASDAREPDTAWTWLSVLVGWRAGIPQRQPLDSTIMAYEADLFSRYVTGLPHIYGDLGPYAPDFFHPLAFSLKCMAFFQSRRARAWSCIFWISVNVVFELGQRNGTEVITSLSAHFESFQLLQHAGRYFGNGTFALYDLAALGGGKSESRSPLGWVGLDSRSWTVSGARCLDVGARQGVGSSGKNHTSL